MKILMLDIETAPVNAYVWGLFKQNINIDWVREPGRVLCFAAKWAGEDEVMFVSENSRPNRTTAHKKMIRTIHGLLHEADAIVHYNGNRFDIPTLNTEFLSYGMEPPPPNAQIDLLVTVKKRFRLPSNKMDFVARIMGIERKLHHRGPDLWMDCMDGDQPAWFEMEAYNRQDVIVLEQMYYKLLPWITNHPHVGIRKGVANSCPNCGSTNLKPRGTAYTKLTQYHRFRCGDCGTWTRGNKSLLGAVQRQVV
ncbi:MAG: ribonuclease H-like domain-containing protein [Nitrospira sp.]|nr:ribonuclease H-like domain-containing protein [Nitrospira sp.]